MVFFKYAGGGMPALKLLDKPPNVLQEMKVILFAA
jgi:hypothetical protein